MVEELSPRELLEMRREDRPERARPPREPLERPRGADEHDGEPIHRNPKNVLRLLFIHSHISFRQTFRLLPPIFKTKKTQVPEKPDPPPGPTGGEVGDFLKRESFIYSFIYLFMYSFIIFLSRILPPIFRPPSSASAKY